MWKIFKRKSEISVEIGEDFVKVFRLSSDREIISCGMEILDEGIIENGSIVKRQELSIAIQSALMNVKPKSLYSGKNEIKISLSLPSSKVFLHNFNLKCKNVTPSVIDQLIEDAEKIIPFNMEALYWTYSVSSNVGNGQRQVLFAAIEKKILIDYLDVLKMIKIRPSMIDVKACCLVRALIGQNAEQGSLLIAEIFGHRANIISVCGSGEFLLNTNVNLPLQEDGILFNEVNLIINNHERLCGEKINKILLVGDFKLLSKIKEPLQNSTNKAVEFGNPLKFIEIKEEVRKSQIANFLPFSSVIGLALRTTGLWSGGKGLDLLEGVHGSSSNGRKKGLGFFHRKKLFLMILAGILIVTLFLVLFFEEKLHFSFLD